MEYNLNNEGMRKTRTGILGGTFDPVHFGHIYLAEAARDKFDLDIVLFMPTDDPYYKSAKEVSVFADRYNMVKLGLEGRKGLEASSFELENDTDGYTINSLSIYKSLHPDEDIYFIVGGDSLFTMEKWKDVDKIFKMAKILVSCRKDEAKGASGSLSITDESSDPDANSTGDNSVTEKESDLSEELDRKIEYLKNKYDAEIFNLYAPRFDISSSELREMIRNGEPVDTFIPGKTIEYIREQKLYTVKDNIKQ